MGEQIYWKERTELTNRDTSITRTYWSFLWYSPVTKDDRLRCSPDPKSVCNQSWVNFLSPQALLTGFSCPNISPYYSLRYLILRYPHGTSKHETTGRPTSLRIMAGGRMFKDVCLFSWGMSVVPMTFQGVHTNLLGFLHFICCFPASKSSSLLLLYSGVITQVL